MAKHFVLALVHKENDVFGISFPDYPGCISGGDSLGETVSSGASALSFHLRGLAKDGLEIRPPSNAEQAFHSSSEEIKAGAMPALIEIDFPGKAVRINISIEEGLLTRVDRAAQERGQSRSAYLAEAARATLLA